MTSNTYTIDAKGKKLGRVASEAAKFLMGKDRVNFTRMNAPEVSVSIVNASALSISEKKRKNITYAHFSGYQGGLRFEKLSALVARKGYRAALQAAIKGMLPNNKLRPGMLKRLHITE